MSFRTGSSPGSSISRTRGMGRLYRPAGAVPACSNGMPDGHAAPGAASRAAQGRGEQPPLDRRQRFEDDLADDLKTPGRDLVEGVLRRVPWRKVEVDQEHRGNAGPQKWRVVVLDCGRRGQEVCLIAQAGSRRPDQVAELPRRVRLASDVEVA